MQFGRDAYLDLLTFGPAPRPMFVELFGPLVGLEDEWRAQGAAPGELDLTDFEWDYVPVTASGGRCHPVAAPPIVLEDTPEHRVERDYLGRTVKLIKRTATIPLPLDFPVRTMDDWLRLKPLYTFSEDRIDWAQVERAAAEQAAGSLVVASIPGAFDTPRELMGEENACLAYYDQPELMRDIVDTLTDTALRVLGPISRRLTIDQLSVHEDFAGKSGPLVGPAVILEYFLPYYRAVWELLRSRGARLFQQDSDGNLEPVIPALLDCGLNCLYPMEPAAGMDIVALRARYGNRFATLGGIDKHVLRQGRAAIRRELEYKLQPCMRSGAVFGLDHRIPDGTPLDAYRHYVDLGRELLGLPARDGTGRGWRRMAF